MTEDLFSRTIYYNPEKEIQVRVTINEFRNVQYFHIRRYFLDFEGEWVPTKDGISMPLEISSTLALFLAVSELISEAEKGLIDEALNDIINSYNESVTTNDAIHF